MVEALVADGFADKAEVEDLEACAFGEGGPAVYGEGGLGRDEELEVGFCAAEEARGGGFCALVDDAAEVEVLDEAGEFGASDAWYDRGADGAHEVGVAEAGKEGGGVEAGYADRVPLSVEC